MASVHTHEFGDVKAISVTERSLAIIGAFHMQLHELILTPSFVKSVINGLKAPIRHWQIECSVFNRPR